jgi:threonine dehydrogenase-like Zn-dependent dehydrogenase
VAILAGNAPDAAALGLSALRPRGRLVIFSAVHRSTTVDLVAVHRRELEIVGSCNDEDRLDEATQCLSDPALALHENVTHLIPFERWDEAFTLARDGHDRALKVALTFPEGP